MKRLGETEMDELDVNWGEYIRKSTTAKIDENEVIRASAKLDEIEPKLGPRRLRSLFRGSENEEYARTSCVAIFCTTV